MLFVALLFLTAVAALPTVPLVAIVPVNFSVPLPKWTGVGPIPAGFAGFSGFPPETTYHKVEFQFLDFQMNQTTPFASNLIQNIEIYTNITLGPHSGFPNGNNFTEETTGTGTSEIPTTVAGYTQLFNGLYNGNNENKINIDRTITGDVCGFDYNGGYFDVWVRPTNAATAGAFHEGYYTCFYNLNWSTTIVHEGESRWSGILQCNSGNLNNYSFRLWYQVRYYNIEPKTCQAGFIHAGN